MKNTKKIRQLIQEVRERVRCPHGENVGGCDFCETTKLLEQALDLLPCKTCNGTGRVSNIGGRAYTTNELCPDCK